MSNPLYFVNPVLRIQLNDTFLRFLRVCYWNIFYEESESARAFIKAVSGESKEAFIDALNNYFEEVGQ